LPIATTFSPPSETNARARASANANANTDTNVRASTEALGAQRYSIRFTADEKVHEQFQELRSLLRHSVPDGDVGKILARAIGVLKDGGSCESREAIEFHHRVAWARCCEHTVENIALRCRSHDQHEGELDFGAEHMARFRRKTPAQNSRSEAEPRAGADFRVDSGLNHRLDSNPVQILMGGRAREGRFQEGILTE
jgi:hypothetical protein